MPMPIMAAGARSVSRTYDGACPLSEAFIDAAESIGVKRCADFCGEDIEGVGYSQTTTAKGRRVSTARAYLKPARGGPISTS